MFEYVPQEADISHKVDVQDLSVSLPFLFAAAEESDNLLSEITETHQSQKPGDCQKEILLATT